MRQTGGYLSFCRLSVATPKSVHYDLWPLTPAICTAANHWLLPLLCSPALLTNTVGSQVSQKRCFLLSATYMNWIQLKKNTGFPSLARGNLSTLDDTSKQGSRIYIVIKNTQSEPLLIKAKSLPGGNLQDAILPSFITFDFKVWVNQFYFRSSRLLRAWAKGKHLTAQTAPPGGRDWFQVSMACVRSQQKDRVDF